MDSERKNEVIHPNDFSGCYVAVITPFKEGDGLSNSVDLNKLDMLIDDLVETSVDGLVACGTTGQDSALSHNEQVDLAKYFFDRINGRKSMIVGAGSNSTREAVYLSEAIEEKIGPTTFLHATGYKNNPTQDGLYKHFTTIADKLKESNLVLYTVPGRTGSNIEAQTTIKLSENPSIIGIKDASGNLKQVMDVVNSTDSDNFKVHSGEDHLVADIIQLGGYGVISASANVAPEYFSKIVKTALGGKHKESHEMQDYILPLVKGVFALKNPIPLAHMFDTEMRLPMCKNYDIQERLDDILGGYRKEELGLDIDKYKRG